MNRLHAMASRGDTTLTLNATIDFDATGEDNMHVADLIQTLLVGQLRDQDDPRLVLEAGSYTLQLHLSVVGGPESEMSHEV